MSSQNLLDRQTKSDPILYDNGQNVIFLILKSKISMKSNIVDFNRIFQKKEKTNF